MCTWGTCMSCVLDHDTLVELEIKGALWNFHVNKQELLWTNTIHGVHPLKHLQSWFFKYFESCIVHLPAIFWIIWTKLFTKQNALLMLRTGVVHHFKMLKVFTAVTHEYLIKMVMTWKQSKTGLKMHSAASWQWLPCNQWARAETTCEKNTSIKSLCGALLLPISCSLKDALCLCH